MRYGGKYRSQPNECVECCLQTSRFFKGEYVAGLRNMCKVDSSTVLVVWFSSSFFSISLLQINRKFIIYQSEIICKVLINPEKIKDAWLVTILQPNKFLLIPILLSIKFFYLFLALCTYSRIFFSIKCCFVLVKKIWYENYHLLSRRYVAFIQLRI